MGGTKNRSGMLLAERVLKSILCLSALSGLRIGGLGLRCRALLYWPDTQSIRHMLAGQQLCEEIN